MALHPIRYWKEWKRRKINPFDFEYHRVIWDILDNGTECEDRTGIGTIDLTGQLMRFPLGSGRIPVATTKQTAVKTAIRELLWMVSGNTNIKPLIEKKVRIWTEWPTKNWLRRTGQTIPAKDDTAGWAEACRQFEFKILNEPGFAEEFGDLGPIYQHQWRHWPGPDGKPIDQLARAIERIKTNPECRRNIVETWNVGYLDAMAVAGLPPCHKTYQFRVRKGKLDLLINQRSCDMFLGVPLNVIFYATLLCMVAQLTGYERGDLVWVGVSCHVYKNHLDQMRLQLSRPSFEAPFLDIRQGVASIDDFRFEDFTIRGYKHHPKIEGAVAI